MLPESLTRLEAAPSVPNERLLHSFATIALSVFVLQALLMVCLPLAGFIAHTAPDDAFYYLEIARRFQDPNWPTFDGLHTTTGFHPLWQLLLVPVASSGPPWLMARVAVAISAMFMLAAAIQLTLLVARTEGPIPALVVWIVLVGALGVVRFGLNGMETPLALFLLSTWCLEVTDSAPRPFRAGLFAGLTVLARIDMLWPLAIGHTWLLMQHRHKLKPWLVAMLVSTAVLLPFVLWNVVHTGHLGTISAATKLHATAEHAQTAFGGKTTLGFTAYAAKNFVLDIASFLVMTWGRGLIYAPLGTALGDYPSTFDIRSQAGLIGAGILVLGTLGFLTVRRIDLRELPLKSSAPSRSFLSWVFGGGAIVHLILCSLLIPGHTGFWYWGLEIGAVAILCGRVFARFSRARKPLVTFAVANTMASLVVVIVTATALARGRFDDRKSFGSAAIAVAEYLDRVVPPDVPVGSCNGGIIGFVANRPVVNLDGLVNDWSYLEARRRGELRAWIRRRGIRYYGDCVAQSARADYAQSLGLSLNEVKTVFRVDGRICEGFVWRIEWPE